MATTTNGFAKVHVASDNGGVDKAWLESLDEGYNTLRSSFKSQTSWSSLAFNEWGEQKGEQKGTKMKWFLFWLVEKVLHVGPILY